MPNSSNEEFYRHYISNRDSYLSEYSTGGSGEPCQEAYAAAFTRIHRDFDNGIAWCSLVSALNAGFGGACFFKNWYDTLFALGEAADQYNACIAAEN